MNPLIAMFGINPEPSPKGNSKSEVLRFFALLRMTSVTG